KLHRALKLARGFERQKMSRRRKNATTEKKDAEVVRIDSEIEALKKLDYPSVAETHLYKTLLKIKSIASHPALPPSITLPSKPAPDTATANVTARLFNANPTKEAMAGIISDVRNILGLDGPEGPSQKKAKAGAADNKKLAKSVAALKVAEEEEIASNSDEESSEASGSEDEFAGFDDRIAGSSEDESEDEDRTRPSANIRKFLSTKDMEITPSPEGSPSASPEPTSKKPQKSLPKPTKSTFIPSLSMGGYISGSDSEPEDIEEQVAPRKNRRGQRARQQIWEKKYGKGAKHVQEQEKKAKKDRNAGWDPIRGATDGSKKTFGRGQNGGRDGGKVKFSSGGRGPKGPTDANAVEVVKRKPKKDDEGKLHPSWEAKKKAKEKNQTVAFQGKKVTFD
ncbi:Bud-site selection protein, partial [Saccharata proteae CBS 121410]